MREMRVANNAFFKATWRHRHMADFLVHHKFVRPHVSRLEIQQTDPIRFPGLTVLWGNIVQRQLFVRTCA